MTKTFGCGWNASPAFVCSPKFRLAKFHIFHAEGGEEMEEEYFKERVRR